MRRSSSDRRARKKSRRSKWRSGPRPTRMKFYAGSAHGSRGSLSMGEEEVLPSGFERRLLDVLGGTLLSLADAVGRLVILTRQTIYWLKSAQRKTVFEQIV